MSDQTWTAFNGRFNDRKYRYEWGIVEEQTRQEYVFSWASKEVYDDEKYGRPYYAHKALDRWVAEAEGRCVWEATRRNGR